MTLSGQNVLKASQKQHEVAMCHISRGEYKEIVKREREAYFGTPFDLAYKAFADLGLAGRKSRYFCENASGIVERMRAKCWEEFQPFEKAFTTKMLGRLIDEGAVSHMSSVEAIEYFVSEYPEHIYDLSLSNTQSRRSRAGKEFEAILELLFIGADISAQTQGAVAKQAFSKSGIGKMVDFVSPGVVQYLANKRNTVLISAKTTLRERWQEVPEEVSRTGIREMYLATLDDAITKETLQILYEANIIIVTTCQNKRQNYSGNDHIITFENLITIMQEAAEKWNSYGYSSEDLAAFNKYFSSQIKKHSGHPYVEAYYRKRLAEL